MSISRDDVELGRIDFSDLIDDAAGRMPPVHPGTLLKEEWLEPLGLTSYRLARDIDVPVNRVTAILAGGRAISADTAMRLGRYLGTSAQLWMNLQAHYELAVAERDHGAEVEAKVRPRQTA